MKLRIKSTHIEPTGSYDYFKIVIKCHYNQKVMKFRAILQYDHIPEYAEYTFDPDLFTLMRSRYLLLFETEIDTTYRNDVCNVLVF